MNAALNAIPRSEKFHYGVGCEPLLPGAEAFSDLFEDVPGDGGTFSCGSHRYVPVPGFIWERLDRPLFREATVESATIGDYVSLREPYRSWHRKPKAAVVEAIRASMIVVNRDRFHFEIVADDESGKAWVFVSYGLIIGSRYLACIRKDSIPAE